MGKNTMMKRSVRMHAEKTGNQAFLNLIPLLQGNVGLIFTKGDLKEVSEEVAKYKGWEEIVVKQEQSNDGSSEMKISLPSMRSLYVKHVKKFIVYKSIVQRFSLSLIEKVFRKDNRTMLFRKDLFKDTL